MTQAHDSDDETYLAIEGATLTGVVATADGLRFEFAGADIHFENHYLAHVATLVLAGAILDGAAQALPADVDTLSVRTSREIFDVHLPLPFSHAGACEVTLVLDSGVRIVAKGQAVHVELGPGVKHPYRW